MACRSRCSEPRRNRCSQGFRCQRTNARTPEHCFPVCFQWYTGKALAATVAASSEHRERHVRQPEIAAEAALYTWLIAGHKRKPGPWLFCLCLSRYSQAELSVCSVIHLPVDSHARLPLWQAHGFASTFRRWLSGACDRQTEHCPRSPTLGGRIDCSSAGSSIRQ